MECVGARAERSQQLLELCYVKLPFRFARPLVPVRCDGANETPRTWRPLAMRIVEWVHAPWGCVESPKRELLSKDDFHSSDSSVSSSSSAPFAASALPSRYSFSRGQKTSVMGCGQNPAALIAAPMSTSSSTSCS